MDKEQRIEFGKRLRRLRNAKGLTTVAVAEKMGVSQATYSEYETGKTMPRVDKLSKLADLFGVSTDFLLHSSSTEMNDLKKMMERNDLNFDGIPLDKEEIEKVKGFLEWVIREKIK